MFGAPEPEVAISPIDFNEEDQDVDGFAEPETPLAGHLSGGGPIFEKLITPKSLESNIRYFNGGGFPLGPDVRRPRTATGMSDLTRSSASPTKTRGYSMASSAGDLVMSPPRFNSEATVNTCGQTGISNQRSVFGVGIRGMEINTLSEKEVRACYLQRTSQWY